MADATRNANQSVYGRSRVVRRYVAEASLGLTEPEKFCLNLVPASNRGSILDIGIGAGRTTGPLSVQFRQYIGIDYSAAMIKAAKRIYSDCDLRVMDARSLQFEPCSFDCVVFSYSGIDSVGYDDRHKIFREIARVLNPGGYFIYSTKNIHYWKMPSWKDTFWHPAIFESWKSPIRCIPNRFRNFWKQSIDPERGIAFINEQGSGFSLVNAYVDIPKELATLEKYGLSAMDMIGRLKTTSGYDSDDEWVYITLRKR
jgi:SAM-dependent methyltransferase